MRAGADCSRAVEREKDRMQARAAGMAFWHAWPSCHDGRRWHAPQPSRRRGRGALGRSRDSSATANETDAAGAGLASARVGRAPRTSTPGDAAVATGSRRDRHRGSRGEQGAPKSGPAAGNRRATSSGPKGPIVIGKRPERRQESSDRRSRAAPARCRRGQIHQCQGRRERPPGAVIVADRRRRSRAPPGRSSADGRAGPCHRVRTQLRSSERPGERPVITQRRVPVIGRRPAASGSTRARCLPQASSGDALVYLAVAATAQQVIPLHKTRLGASRARAQISTMLIAHGAETSPVLGLNPVYHARASLAQRTSRGDAWGHEQQRRRVPTVDGSTASPIAAACIDKNFFPIFSYGASIPRRHEGQPPISTAPTARKPHRPQRVPWFLSNKPGSPSFRRRWRSTAPARPPGASITGWVSAKLFERATRTSPNGDDARRASRPLSIKDDTLGASRSRSLHQGPERSASDVLVQGHGDKHKFTSPMTGRSPARVSDKVAATTAGAVEPARGPPRAWSSGELAERRIRRCSAGRSSAPGSAPSSRISRSPGWRGGLHTVRRAWVTPARFARGPIALTLVERRTDDGPIYAIRQSLRQRSRPSTAMLFLGAPRSLAGPAIISSATRSSTRCTLLNRGSWVEHIPMDQPNGHLLPEPLLFVETMYASAIRSKDPRRIHHATSETALPGFGSCGSCCARLRASRCGTDHGDVLRAHGLYAYPGRDPRRVGLGRSPLSVPLYECLLWGGFLTFLARCGTSATTAVAAWSSAAASRCARGSRARTGLRLLALVGVVNVGMLIYNAGMMSLNLLCRRPRRIPGAFEEPHVW